MVDLPGYLFASTGELERPINSSGWLIPDKVWHDSTHIYWQARLVKSSNFKPGVTATQPVFPARVRNGGRGMLLSFLSLKSAPVDTIAKFVSDWGPLTLRKRIWDDNREAWYSDWQLPYLPFDDPKGIRFDTERSILEGKEPVETWRYWADKFHAALDVWDGLKQGQEAFESSAWKDRWNVFTDRDEAYLRVHRWPGKGNRPAPKDHEDARFVLGEKFAWLLHSWMITAHIDLDLTYSSPEARFVGFAKPHVPVLHFGISTRHVFAGLVLQLVAALSGVSGFSRCSLCGVIYTPGRQPHVGKLNYCERCRKRTANALRVRLFRERQRKKKRIKPAKGARS